MTVVNPQDIPAMARAVEKALQAGEPIGPAIEPFVMAENIPSWSAESFLMHVDITIYIPLDGQECCYQRLPLDRVVMCDPSRLPIVDWLSIALHECCHFVEWRLGWIKPPAIGELRAEVGQALLEKLLGLPFCDDLGNYNKWVGEWLRHMDRDDDFVFDAVQGAIEAVEYLIDRALNSQPWSPRRKYINECLGRLLDYVRQDQDLIAG